MIPEPLGVLKWNYFETWSTSETTYHIFSILKRFLSFPSQKQAVTLKLSQGCLLDKRICLVTSFLILLTSTKIGFWVINYTLATLITRLIVINSQTVSLVQILTSYYKQNLGCQVVCTPCKHTILQKGCTPEGLLTKGIIFLLFIYFSSM